MNRQLLKIWGCVLLIVWITGCRRQYVKSIEDDKLIVQAFRSGSDKTMIKVRVINKIPIEKDTQEAFNRQMLQMDSCFKLECEEGKILPRSVVPVMSGLKDTYEYLLDFSNQHVIGKDALVFKPILINRKTYTVDI